jgi:hypothetical protein
MKRTFTVMSLAGAGLLTAAMLATAQTPPPDSPSTPPPRPQRPQQPPRDPGQTPGAERPAIGGAQSGYLAMPRGAQALSGTLAANSIQIFAEADFKGEQAVIDKLNTAKRAGTINEIAGNLNDDATAVRWNIDPGLIVLLYAEPSGMGEQLILWGKGQFTDLNTCNFNDTATRWAWFDVGGGKMSGSADTMAPPNGAQTIGAAVPEDTIQLFESVDFKDKMQQVARITTQKAGNPIALPGEFDNAASSIRWNLSEGVIVLLADDQDNSQHLGIWGQGQFADLGKCDFDDEASRWYWAYVGEPAGGMKPGDNNRPGENRPGSTPPPREP